MTYIRSSQQFKGFSESFVNALEQFNVRHIEQLASLLVSPTGEEGLRRLNLGADVSAIRSATEKYLRTTGPQGLQLTPDAFNDPDRPANRQALRAMGYTTKLQNRYQMFGDVPPAANEAVNGQTISLDESLADFPVADLHDHELARMIYPEGEMPQARDQGSRGTCVAFATTAMLESFIQCHVPKFSRTLDFSEQYLFYMAKHKDANHDEDGTQFEFALDVLKEHGICAATNLPYRSFNDWSHSLLFDKSLHDKKSLARLARGTRISGYLHLPFYDIVSEIKNCLDRKLPVGVGVLVFQDAWYENDYTAMKGEIALPLISDEDGKEILMDVCRGGHAITIYGYEEKSSGKNSDAERPGGGGFIFRNSWGNNWAFNSDYSKGYGVIPYGYIQRYAVDACIVTGVQS